MQGNDISNGTPPRILVHHDVVFVPSEKEVKRWFTSKTVVDWEYDTLVLNRLWQLKDRIGCILELFCVGCDVGSIERRLDTETVNPFNQIRNYVSLAEFVKELPYRPDVVGVVDIPSRELTYGSKAFDLSRVGL